MFKKNETVIYVFGVLIISSLIAFVAHSAGNENLSILTVFTPSLLALVMVLSMDGMKGAKALFVGRLIQPFGLGWLVVAISLFPLVGIVAVGLHSLYGGPALGLRSTQLMPQLIVILLISFGEEFGWRGYLLPKLQERCSPWLASLILGAVWGVWHYPASLIGTGVPQEMSFGVFLAWVLIATQLMTWVYNHTGSVLTAIVMHSMANVTFNYLPLLPEFVGQIQTFYCFLAVLAFVSAILLWRFGREELLEGSNELLPDTH